MVNLLKYKKKILNPIHQSYLVESLVLVPLKDVSAGTSGHGTFALLPQYFMRGEKSLQNF